MKLLIVGASDSAVALITRITHAKSGAEVVLVDRNRDKLDRLSETVDCGMVVGDGTAPAILKEAIGDSCPDVLVLLTDSDQTNLIAALLGRNLGIETVLPQVQTPEVCAACRELGVERWIAPDELIAQEIESAIGMSLNRESEGDQEET
ncbi:MAG: potassium channel family protein [Geminicoccaceae bacterium]